MSEIGSYWGGIGPCHKHLSTRTQTQTDRQTDGQTDRQTDRQTTDRQDRQVDHCLSDKTDKCALETDRMTDKRQIDKRLTDCLSRQTSGHLSVLTSGHLSDRHRRTDRQTDWQTDRQTDRQTRMHHLSVKTVSTCLSWHLDTVWGGIDPWGQVLLPQYIKDVFTYTSTMYLYMHTNRQGVESDGSDWHLLWRDGFVWRSLSVTIYQWTSHQFDIARTA